LTVVVSAGRGTISGMSERSADHLPEPFAYARSWVANVARKQPHDRYIGRASRGFAASAWGNPHHLVGNSTRSRLLAVAAYAGDALGRLDAIGELTGLRLGCWCAPKLCHGHVLAALANDLTAGDLFSGDHTATVPAGLSARAELVAAWRDDLAATAAAMPYRLLVTGSRSWTDRVALANAINAQWSTWGRPARFTLVVGDADGADRIAREIVAAAGFDAELHVADWEQFGRRAGMRRNAEMIASGADALIACWDGVSPGTKGCIDAAAKAGLRATLLRP
jgi:hypothetical protein